MGYGLNLNIICDLWQFNTHSFYNQNPPDDHIFCFVFTVPEPQLNVQQQQQLVEQVEILPAPGEIRSHTKNSIYTCI